LTLRAGRIVTVLVITLAAFALISCDEADSPLKAGFDAGSYKTVVAFGDSIVEGVGQPEGWPEMLGRDLAAKYSGVRVINAGVSGNTAADGLARLQSDVLSNSPDLVLVSFGLNDMKNKLSHEQFRQDLSGVISGIRGSGAQVVLLTTTQLQRGASLVAKMTPEPFNAIIHQTARQEDLPLIDIYEEFHGFNSTKYLMDVAHPNLDGYRVLADIIRKGLIGE
jgi:lysophospholipase L1-like esterase